MPHSLFALRLLHQALSLVHATSDCPNSSLVCLIHSLDGHRLHFNLSLQQLESLVQLLIGQLPNCFQESLAFLLTDNVVLIISSDLAAVC